MVGRTLGHYRIIEKIGAGGMGEVWLAEDTRLGRKVALKFLPAEAARDALRRRRFEQEARAAAALSHPNIATVHELAETDGLTYIVFEYVPGSTLRSLVMQGGLHRDELLDIAGDIADALVAAHGTGVVHRDLKPENVIRTPAGRCKVLDFGLARWTETPETATETRSVLTTAGMVVGTAKYMAPEQLEGKEVDFRCDIFAFGTLLYELATGVHPFQASSSASTIAAIMAAESPPLTQSNPEQPLELERIVRKCLRKRREERYQSTPDLAVDLHNLKRDSGDRPSGRAAAVPPSPPAEAESLLSAIFARIGVSPRTWWQLHALLVVFVYVPLTTYVVLRSEEVFGPGNPDRLWIGVSLFFFLGSIIGMVCVRLYQLGLSVFLPGQLESHVRNRQGTVRGLDLALAALLLIPTLVSLQSPAIWTHTGLMLALAGASVWMAITGAWLGPAIDRAGFRRAFAEVERDPTRTLRLGIAAAQANYLWPLWMPVITGKISLDRSMQNITWNIQLASILYLVFTVLASLALLISAGRLLTQGLPAVRHFRRWFPAYASVGWLGYGPYVWVLREEVPAVMLVVAAIIWFIPLPIAQWRMASRALRESGELKEEPHVARYAQRRSTVWWWSHQLSSMLATTPLVILLSWEARPFMSHDLREPIFLFNVLALGLHWSARFVLVSQAVGNPANLAAQARHMRRSIRWTGWPVVGGLLASAFSVANSNILLASFLAALAMGGVACLIFLDPAVERAAFPSSFEGDV